MARSVTGLAFAAVLGSNSLVQGTPSLRGAGEAAAPANTSRALRSGPTKYIEYYNKNAYQPFGATDIDNEFSAPVGLTSKQCQDRCTADSSCSCVSWQRSTGKCWKRSACYPTEWTSPHNDGFNVFLKADHPLPGWFQFRLFNDQDKCMRVKDFQSSNGAAVHLWDCEEPWVVDDPEDFWSVDNADADINGVINWATHPSKCLDVKDGKSDNGTPLQLWDCTKANHLSQQFYLDWSIRPDGSETIPRTIGRLRWKNHPGKCVVAANGDTSNGNALVLADCGNYDYSQYWVNDYTER